MKKKAFNLALIQIATVAVLLAASSLCPEPALCAEATADNNIGTNAVAAITQVRPAAEPTTDTEALAKGGGFLAPVTRLQNEVIKLEQRLAKLNIPLDKLEPGTFHLSHNMVAIQAQTAELLKQMDSTQTEMRTLRSEITTLRQPIVELRTPVMELRKPVASLQGPVALLYEPLKNVVAQVGSLQLPLSSVKSGLSSLNNRFTELDSRFTELDGRFLELDGRFAKLDGRFASLGDELGRLQSVLFWLLISIAILASLTIVAVAIFLGILLARAIARVKGPITEPRVVDSLLS